MKYQYQALTVPENKRAEYNEKILALIASGNMQGLTPDEVFNIYSGLGGLHGLSFQEYENFHAYTEAKKEIELGQFFTPPALCEQIIESLQPLQHYRIADLTCGSGNFFNYLPTEQFIYGCEIEQGAFQVARFLYPHANIVKCDFVKYEPDTQFDLVIGNPPFNLQTEKGVSQYVYLRKAAEYLKPAGLLCFIAPEKFLEDEYTNRKKWEEINSDFNFICQCKLPAHWFDVDINVKLLYFQKKGVSNSNKQYENTYIKFDAKAIYQNLIKPLQEQTKADAARLHLFNIQNAVDSSYWQYRITKYLYHIKAQKVLRDRYLIEALDKIHLLKTQKKPEDMKQEEWQQKKLTDEKVAKWLYKKVCSQYKPKPVKVLKAVKTNYGIKIKAYHKGLINQQTTQSMHDAVLNLSEPPQAFKKLIERKRRQYTLQNMSFEFLSRDEKLDQFLTDFFLQDTEAGFSLFGDDDKIKLNEKQLYDCGLAFQKNYSILNWQMGGGKSVAGMAWIDYNRDKVKNIVIAAPALAVQLTWNVRLKKYGYDFINVTKWQDVYNIQPRQIVVLSFNMVTELERHLKGWVKRLSYKIGLLVDESDELTNPFSRRTQAMQSVFRKARKKILTTGTTTRNNVNELYPQLELLFNNSINFICRAETVYMPDKDGMILPRSNAYWQRPFPAYRGHNLFKYCFCPQRTTVFGVKQDTQDIYNVGILKDIIARTIITRTFEDIVGGKIYSIKTHQVEQSPAEEDLYALIINDFLQICYTYYTSTGNSRKEAALRLIRQIMLLIDSTSTPHLMPDYKGSQLPNKFYYIRDLIKSIEGKCSIGTVTIDAAKEYFTYIEKEFPQRQSFYIDGTKTFSQRKKIIAAFQRTNNGILISTQQSLKSSVDIETCDDCILEAMQWNIPKMSQYYFRFIRYNSKNKKRIHFVSYAHTIEQNILALLMAKEKLNEFVKTMEVQDRADLYEEFDVDMNILNSIIEKEYDHEGKLTLRWGKQSFTR